MQKVNGIIALTAYKYLDLYAEKHNVYTVTWVLYRFNYSTISL